MRIRKERGNLKVSNQTRDVLDTAITSIVQAIGSKAGVLVFWDEKRDTPGHISPYGLTPAAFDELRPVIYDLVERLRRGEPFRFDGMPPSEHERSEELPALKVDLPTPQGPLQIIALPIYAENRFFAALCLIQSANPAGSTLPSANDVPVLPPGSPLGVGPDNLEVQADGLSFSPYSVVLDENEVVARNAHLLRQLVQEKNWLEAIISYSADGILIVDNTCNILGFNPSFARLTGWTVEELRGQNCYEALGFKTRLGKGECGLACPVKLGTYVNLPEAERRSEVVLTTKDGEKRDVELTYSVILSAHRAILGGIIGARDITARKEAEELQSTFLSVISHELQTPIAIIKGYAGLFADEKTELQDAQVREKMNIIKEESDRLSKLVENLLYASRLQAGGIELERAPVDLSGLIKRVVQKMKGVSKQHPLKVSLPDDLPAVLADYDKIQQVLVNLIENAIKYTPKGGPIVIEAEPTSTEVIVSVTDQGIGVPESERQRIFDRFSRLDSRYVRERKGAGLGLYICKAIIEAHGGRIWVEPVAVAGDAPGSMSGSRFKFSLPREEPAALPVLFGKI